VFRKLSAAFGSVAPKTPISRTIRPKRIERSSEIYKAIAADAAACGMTPKQFAELFMEQVILELRKFSWTSSEDGV
jgi:hypothetical protein